jgi:hypothetical protein
LHLWPPPSEGGRLLLTYILDVEDPAGLAPTVLTLCRRLHLLLCHGSEMVCRKRVERFMEAGHSGVRLRADDTKFGTSGGTCTPKTG